MFGFEVVGLRSEGRDDSAVFLIALERVERGSGDDFFLVFRRSGIKSSRGSGDDFFLVRLRSGINSSFLVIDGGGTGRGSSLFSVGDAQEGVRPSIDLDSSVEVLGSCRDFLLLGGETGFGGASPKADVSGGAGSNSVSESRSTE